MYNSAWEAEQKEVLNHDFSVGNQEDDDDDGNEDYQKFM